MDAVGHVVIRMDHGDWDDTRGALQAYLRGEPEPVRSSFSLSFNSVVNLLHHNPLPQAAGTNRSTGCSQSNLPSARCACRRT